MAREKVLGNEDLAADDEDKQLRPSRFDDMIGQRDVIERIRIAVEAAGKRQDPLGHTLFDGPPGLGKTTFATCIPNELGVPLQITSGAILKAPKDLVTYLTNVESRSVLFIDEIHRLPRAVEEYLYTAMEDFRIDIILGEGVNARTINYSIRPFTLIGATTRAGMLSGPLRDRFQLREHLGFYDDTELQQIVIRNAAKLDVAIDEDAAEIIAVRGRGTPRVTINHLRWARDFAESRADGKITRQVALDALAMSGVDALGLQKLDRKYLETMLRVFGGGPVGVEALAHTINTAVDTLSDEVEPFLLRSELVVRTPRGRVATTKAYEHLNVAPPDPHGDPQGKLF